MDNANQQRDAPNTIMVVRGPLAIAFDDYVVLPNGRRIGDTPIEVELDNVVVEWLDSGKLQAYIQPAEQAKE